MLRSGPQRDSTPVNIDSAYLILNPEPSGLRINVRVRNIEVPSNHPERCVKTSRGVSISPRWTALRQRQ